MPRANAARFDFDRAGGWGATLDDRWPPIGGTPHRYTQETHTASETTQTSQACENDVQPRLRDELSMTLGRVPMTLRPALLAALLLVVARAQHRDALPAYLIDPVPAWERARALWNISAPIRPHEARAIRRHWAHGTARGPRRATVTPELKQADSKIYSF